MPELEEPTIKQEELKPQQLMYTVANSDGSLIQLTQPQYLFHLDGETRKADAALKFAQMEEAASRAFQLKAQVMINGMSEIRFALAGYQIDDEKVTGFQERTPLKSAFSGDDGIDYGILKNRYLELSKIYLEFIGQIKIRR